MARGITTAIRWFYNQPMRSFQYDDIDGAARHLGLAPATVAKVNETLTRERATPQ